MYQNEFGNVIGMLFECARVSLGMWFGIVEKFQEKVYRNVVWNRGKVSGKSLGM